MIAILVSTTTTGAGMQGVHHPTNLETLQPARRLFPVLAREWVGFPAVLSSLSGRRQEVIQVSSLVEGCHQRLVSSLGPGGAGKTRLAIALAEHVESSFPGGAVFVPLALLSRPGDVPATVAARLGVVNHPDRTTTQSIVATIREPLRVTSEQRYVTLPLLTQPPVQNAQSLTTLPAVRAVRLGLV